MYITVSGTYFVKLTLNIGGGSRISSLGGRRTRPEIKTLIGKDNFINTLLLGKNKKQVNRFSLRKIIRPKLRGNCAFPQNFHTMKLGEITGFYPVSGIQDNIIREVNTNKNV